MNTSSSADPAAPSCSLASRRGAGGDGRSRRWTRHREQRRLELLRLVREAVAELGADASMAQIATRCKTSKSVFYRYFRDKDGLRRELATHIVERMRRRMAAAAQEAQDLDDSVRAVIGQYLWQLENAPEVYRFVVTGAQGDPENAVSRFAAAVAEILAEAHARHAPPDRRLAPPAARYWATGVVGLARGAGEAWMADAADPDAAGTRPALEEFVEIVTAWAVSSLDPPTARVRRTA